MKMEKATCTVASPPYQTFNSVENVKPEPLMKREELADYLNVCGRTVDRLVRSGSLPFVKLGSGRNAALRFRRLAVDEALAKGGRR